MSDEDIDAARTFKVVVNDEGFHSIWPVDRPNPLGWADGGKVGVKSECLDYIAEVWTDMTPKSVRRALDTADPLVAEEGR